MVNYIDKLKEKCDIDNRFYEIVDELFQKLLEFGYITHHQVKKLEKKLYNNIETILLGNETSIDYKTGYYDAPKKELYLKDLSNTEAVFLRLLYILTTTEVATNNYDVGYSTANLSKADYKIIHRRFGLNRAVVSNLVCRLLYTQPTTLSIMPTYRSYENDFLGNKISSDNDIYFLEGKLIKQICYIFDLNEENLYYNLFNNPTKYINRFFNKLNYENQEEILDILDEVSIKYSNYNKLVYLNKMLDTNYLNIRKTILHSDITIYEKEKERIKLAIRNALEPLVNDDNEDELENDVESYLAEKINNLEEDIVNSIAKLQNMLVDYLVSSEAKFSAITYAIKLKELEKMLVIANDTLKETIFNTISQKLMNNFELTASNLVEKIKYSIINEILSSDKYIKIYKNMKFAKLNGLSIPENTALVALSVDDSFIQLVKVDCLSFSMRKLENNAKSISIENMGYLLNNPSATKDIHLYEQIFTAIHSKFPKFSNIRIENMYTVNVLDTTLVIVLHDDTFSIIQVNKTEYNNVTTKLVKLSENYSLYNFHNMSNLPVVYNKKDSLVEKVLAFFAIFS